MPISPILKRCVGFIFVNTQQGLRPIGTAFFIGRDGSDSSPARVFIATARHVIDMARPRSVDGIIYIRLNKPDGKLVNLLVPLDLWEFHPTDAQADVAVVFGHSPDPVDICIVDETMTMTYPQFANEDIGLAEEVCTVGLFVNHYGNDRNIPIVRVGAIAAMPEEPLQSADGPREAFLVEMRSIGGLSGSPVFLNMGAARLRRGEFVAGVPTNPQDAYGMVRLIGVVHGHWTLPRNQVTPLLGEAVNMGMAMVTPISKVLEIMQHILTREGLGGQAV